MTMISQRAADRLSRPARRAGHSGMCPKWHCILGGLGVDGLRIGLPSNGNAEMALLVKFDMNATTSSILMKSLELICGPD
jgi:hypothetical protein